MLALGPQTQSWAWPQIIHRRQAKAIRTTRLLQEERQKLAWELQTHQSRQVRWQGLEPQTLQIHR